MKQHIHNWNDYKEGKLCCSNCGMLHTKYLLNCLQKRKSQSTEKKNKNAKFTKVVILDDNPLSVASYMQDHPDVDL